MCSLIMGVRFRMMSRCVFFVWRGARLQMLLVAGGAVGLALGCWMVERRFLVKKADLAYADWSWRGVSNAVTLLPLRAACKLLKRLL